MKKDTGFSRRRFLGGTAITVLGHTLGVERVLGQAPRTATPDDATDLALVNGSIHTMDATNRVVSQVLVRNGRFSAVGNNVAQGRGVRRIDLKGKTVIPGLIDAHNHIVLVGTGPDGTRRSSTSSPFPTQSRR